MFSPVPTQTVFGFDGSSVMAPIEYESCPSKIGFQVVPELTVFQTPPEPTATYQTLGLSGCSAISAIRPDMNAGPMVRSSRPAKVSALNASSSWATTGISQKARTTSESSLILRLRVHSNRKIIFTLQDRFFYAGSETEHCLTADSRRFRIPGSPRGEHPRHRYCHRHQ